MASSLTHRGRSQMDSQGWINLEILQSFPRVKELQIPTALIRDTLLQFSQFIEIRGAFGRAARDGWRSFVMPDAAESPIVDSHEQSYAQVPPLPHMFMPGPGMWYAPMPHQPYSPGGVLPPPYYGHPYQPPPPHPYPSQVYMPTSQAVEEKNGPNSEVPPNTNSVVDQEVEAQAQTGVRHVDEIAEERQPSIPLKSTQAANATSAAVST